MKTGNSKPTTNTNKVKQNDAPSFDESINLEDNLENSLENFNKPKKPQKNKTGDANNVTIADAKITKEKIKILNSMQTVDNVTNNNNGKQNYDIVLNESTNRDDKLANNQENANKAKKPQKNKIVDGNNVTIGLNSEKKWTK